VLFCDCFIFIAGFRKTIAQRKFDGRMSQDEGKDRLPLEALAIIAERALQQVKDQRMHIFGAMQALSQFSLICRSLNTSGLTLIHIGWDTDAQVAIISKDKGNFVLP